VALSDLIPLVGPTATIVASVVAVIVTWRLGQSQLRIAEEQKAIAKQQADTARLQAEIAQDRLRFDQFDKRYEIFDSFRQLILIALNESAKKDFSIDVVMPLYRRLHEAPLFFSKETCDFVGTVRKDCQRLFTINASGVPLPPPMITDALSKLSPEDRAGPRKVHIDGEACYDAG
jgi:hypothetical protein